METEELWGKGWSLRIEQDPRAMTYLGTVTKSGIHFHYYRDDDGEIYFDNEPEGGIGSFVTVKSAFVLSLLFALPLFQQLDDGCCARKAMS